MVMMTVAPKATVLDSHPSAHAVRDEKRGVAMIVAQSAQSKDGSQILATASNESAAWELAAGMITYPTTQIVASRN